MGDTTYVFDHWDYRTTAAGSFRGHSDRRFPLDDVGVEECTVRAQYVARRELYVFSTNPTGGVPIVVSASDMNGAQNGATQFTRAYRDGTSVTLTAPATMGANPFKRWRLNGVERALGLRTLSVPMNGTGTAIADFYMHTAGSATSFGVGCAGSNGTDVHMVVGISQIGQVLQLALTGGLPNAPAFLMLGRSRSAWNGAPLPMAIGTAPGCFVNVALDTSLATATDGLGRATVLFPIPNDPSSIGRHIYSQ